MALQLFQGFNDPFFSEMERSLQKAFQPFFNAPMGRSMSERSLAFHPMDVMEYPDKFAIVADAPGMAPEDIHIELKDNVMVVKGEKKLEKQSEEEKRGVRVFRSERSFNKFTRSFVLPENAQVEGITARIDNGVLTVDIPKKPEVPAKEASVRIPVLGASGGPAPAKLDAAPTPSSTTPPTA